MPPLELLLEEPPPELLVVPPLEELLELLELPLEELLELLELPLEELLELLLDELLELLEELLEAVATVNEPGEKAAFLALRITTCPVFPSAGTVIFTCVSLTTFSAASCPLPIHAALAPVNPEPDTVKTVPTGPEVGVKLPIIGCGRVAELAVTANVEGLKAECAGLISAIEPLVASAGTVTVAWVSLITFTVAVWLLPTHAWFDPVKPEPVIVTAVPTGPLAGEIVVMTCCG